MKNNVLWKKGEPLRGRIEEGVHQIGEDLEVTKDIDRQDIVMEEDLRIIRLMEGDHRVTEERWKSDLLLLQIIESPQGVKLEIEKA